MLTGCTHHAERDMLRETAHTILRETRCTHHAERDTLREAAHTTLRETLRETACTMLGDGTESHDLPH